MSTDQQFATGGVISGGQTWARVEHEGCILPPKPPVIQFNGEGGNLIVAIHPGGTIELGPGVSNDEAARAFWDAVSRIAPEWRCSHGQ